MSTTFSKTHQAIEDMVVNTALQTKTARAIVRKAGLKPVVGQIISGTSHPRTVVDAFIDPNADMPIYQWLVDFTGFTQIRFVSTSSVPLYLKYSASTLDAIDPGDYSAYSATRVETGVSELLLTDNSEAQSLSSGLQWYDIPLARRIPLRLSVSESQSPWNTTGEEFSPTLIAGGTFSVAVQVF